MPLCPLSQTEHSTPVACRSAAAAATQRCAWMSCTLALRLSGAKCPHKAEAIIGAGVNKR